MPQSELDGGLLELLPCPYLSFLVAALPTVHSEQCQWGCRLRALETNSTLQEFEFRLCVEVVLCWLIRFAHTWCRSLALCRTFYHGRK